MPITYSVIQINTLKNCSMLGFCYFFSLAILWHISQRRVLYFFVVGDFKVWCVQIQNYQQVTSPFAVQPALWLLRQYTVFFLSVFILLVVNQHCLPCFHVMSVSYHDFSARCFVQWYTCSFVCSEQSLLEFLLLALVKLSVAQFLNMEMDIKYSTLSFAGSCLF